MSHLKEKLSAGEFVVTGEIGPPKGVDASKAWEEALLYQNKIVAANVTDNQNAVMRMSSVALSKGLLDHGIEPIFQMTCRDRNRLALQSDALSAAYFGIENILCLTGDHVVLGDHKGAKPVYDLDSVSLIYALSCMERGYDLEGSFIRSKWNLPLDRDVTLADISKSFPNVEEKRWKEKLRIINHHKMEGRPKFFKGAVVTPITELVDAQIDKMKEKIDAGAEFFQTQAVFEPALFEKFMERVSGFGVPVLCGIVLLKSIGLATYMNINVPGVMVPDPLLKELADTPKGDERKKAIEITTRLVEQIKPMCQGIHLMPLGWTKEAIDVIQATGLNP